MGIAYYSAEAIARALSGRRVEARAFTVGRQTMFFTPEEAVRMTGAAIDPATLETDTETRFGAGKTIADRAFFGLLGIDQLESIDVSDYEGATVVHDLNQPLPAELESIAGLIVDGSTLDNVFNPALALMNLSRMLAPGGLLFSANMASNHYCPYSILTPLWLFDYFVVNRYARVSIYVTVHREQEMNVFTLDPTTMLHGPRSWTDNLTSGHVMGLIVLAEKGPDTSWAETPVQHQYRSSEQQARWLDNLQRFESFGDLIPSTAAQLVTAPAGYRFVPGSGNAARRPLIRRVEGRIRRMLMARPA